MKAMSKSKVKKAAPAASGGATKSNLQTYLWALIVAMTGVGIALLLANRGGSSLPPTAAPTAKKASAPPRKEDLKAPPRKDDLKAPPRREEHKAPPRRRADGAVDKDANCPQWAASGECDSNPDFMLSSCAASCPPAAPRPPPPAEPTTDDDSSSAEAEAVLERLDPDLLEAQRQADAEMDFDPDAAGCFDERPDCAELARANLSACGMAPFMLGQCTKTCRACPYKKLIGDVLARCEDKHETCATWAAAGECAKNKRFMLSSCSVACGVCAAKRSGCARRTVTPGHVAGVDMGTMFKGALRDFPQYSPLALSEAPYVLQFENLIDEGEAADLIARCANRFERSMAGDQVSPVRTSAQCWCDDNNGCTAHPTVVAVTERMMNITRLPLNNAEYMQILQYQPGQFYKQHHDQQTGHWTPQGVRLYTFFVYLSDVEAGGGTKFHRLGLEVKPKRGRAILWPSVYEDDFLKADMRTEHEALPVEAGVKYAANLWLHLYDFRSPSRNGLCPFLGQNTHG